ncbi:unnamed protein product [Auanema sp. JU1783]|nr:unnamed protein product [Auanema sp. JU1783]
MASTGPQWSLYPLLAIIAFCEFSCGLVHLTFCLPFYFLLLPIINGVLGLLASFHAIFLRYPNRCDFLLQLICTSLAFWFVITSCMESYCLGEYNKDEQISHDGVCYGLKYRTNSFVLSCFDFLGPLQLSLLHKLGWEPKDRDGIRFFISCSLSILSVVHLCCTTALTFYSAIETKIRLYSYHYQVVVGVFVFITGIFHLRYCCTFFFMGLPLLIGAYSILQGSITWRTRCHGSLTRAMNIIGSAVSLLLFASTIFGLFCWFHRDQLPKMITRHCHWRPKSEEYCLRVIHFSLPYIDWLPEETDREIAVVQVYSYF